MKISYRREMKHNYLIVDPEELIWRNYECKMLAGNTIRGILQFQLRQIDDEVRFYYEITSRQPLSRMLENHLLREPEIRQIILEISRILDRMEQYLLRENSVLLEPEYIYVEPENFEIWLCLVPGMERDFPCDYGKLLEYLLGKVDHQDRESVILAYGLYQETRKENYGMEDILKLICAERKEASEEEPLRSEIRYQAPAKSDSTVKKEEPGLFSKWKEKWEKRKRARTASVYDPEEVPWEQLFGENSEEKQKGANFVDVCDKALETRIMETERAGKNTTLLADLSLQARTDERKLCALDPGMEHIRIPYYPFIIGKQEHLADYYLNHETVSRLHVRIDQEGTGWTIQDLNSSNGTMVEGRLLENNESAPLHLNDEVKIADLRYRFM